MKSTRSRLVGAAGKRRASRTLATGVAVAATAAGIGGVAVPAAAAAPNPVLSAIPSDVLSWCGLSGISLPLLAAKVDSAPKVAQGMFGVGGKAGEIDYYGNQADYNGPLCEAEWALLYGSETYGSAPPQIADAAAQIGNAIERWSGDGNFADGVIIPLPTDGTLLGANMNAVNTDLKTAANDIQQVIGSDGFGGFESAYGESAFLVYITSMDEASALYDSLSDYGYGAGTSLLLYVAGSYENAGGHAIYNSAAFNRAVIDDSSATSLLYSSALRTGSFWNWYYD